MGLELLVDHVGLLDRVECLEHEQVGDRWNGEGGIGRT
jgi:hypothetical protein